MIKIKGKATREKYDGYYELINLHKLILSRSRSAATMEELVPMRGYRSPLRNPRF